MMTTEKAKEYFSAYLEGELDPGLQEMFLRTLDADGELKEEYMLFKQTYDELMSFEAEEIEPPHNLHALIMERVDANVNFDEVKPASGFLRLWTNSRGPIMAGVAATLILGAGLALLKPGSGKTSEAGVGPSIVSNVGRKGPKTNVTVENGKPVLLIESSSDSAINLRWESGRIVTDTVSAGSQFKQDLTNDSDTLQTISVQVDGVEIEQVIIPGKTKLVVKAGEGNLVDFSKALAGYYQVPVELKSVKKGEVLNWDFSIETPTQAANVALGTDHHVEQREDGTITISDPLQQ